MKIKKLSSQKMLQSNYHKAKKGYHFTNSKKSTTQMTIIPIILLFFHLVIDQMQCLKFFFDYPGPIV